MPDCPGSVQSAVTFREELRGHESLLLPRRPGGLCRQGSVLPWGILLRPRCPGHEEVLLLPA